MKDKQVAPTSIEPRIFFVSAFLHCVSMTALVYLRSSFGFGFLRPKSVFLAFSWAFALYATYAWIDGAAWAKHQSFILFGGGSVTLYLFHLLVAIRREWKQTGEHENYSGASHLTRLVGRSTASPRFEAGAHLWAEPGAVLFASALFLIIRRDPIFSCWLLFVAASLWSKEALNHWFQIRQRKRQRDMFGDTEEEIAPPTATNLAVEPPKATRRERVKRARRNTAATDDQIET